MSKNFQIPEYISHIKQLQSYKTVSIHCVNVIKFAKKG